MNDQVAEVKLKTDIVSIIGERIELKKAGRNFKAICPFHGEKTPSFMVSPELQIFKCFGCDAKGDVYSFLERYEGMEFSEALKYLADRAGIKLQKTSFSGSSEKEKLIEINSQTLRFYNYLLLNHALGKKALEYLLKDRGLKRSTIEEFQLGYSPDNSSFINKFLIDKKKFSPKDIEKAGIGIVRGGGVYDRFSGRIIFPLFDHRGNSIGFAGRILPWDKRETGKYINSPETPLYHKSSVLYALNVSRSQIKKKGVAIIVEGELDAISSYQAGIKNVVAIKGSALTEEQVRLLSRFAPKFILALDADIAGDAAARRGIAVAENAGVEVKVAEMKDFKDPDEAARNDLDGYKKSLIKALPVWDFMIDSTFARNDFSTGEGQAKISRELTPILAEIEDKIVQAHYAGLIARKLGVSVEAVMEQVAKAARGAEIPLTQKDQQEKQVGDRRELLEERFLALTFQVSPEILLKASIEDLIQLPLYKRILEEYKSYSKKHKVFNPTEFSKKLPPELFDGFATLLLKEEESDTYEKELDLVAKELKILDIRQKINDLTTEIKKLEEEGDKDKLLKAQNKFNKFAITLSELERKDVGIFV
jgi:DNA primase